MSQDFIYLEGVYKHLRASTEFFLSSFGFFFLS